MTATDDTHTQTGKSYNTVLASAQYGFLVIATHTPQREVQRHVHSHRLIDTKRSQTMYKKVCRFQIIKFIVNLHDH